MSLKAEQFSNFSLITETPKQNETFLIKLNELENNSLSELNPYKSEDIKIDFYFTSPSGIEYIRPAYYRQEYRSTLDTYNKGNDYIYLEGEIEGNDLLTKVGDPFFSVSFRPKEVGTYQVKAKVEIKNELVQEMSSTIEVIENTKPYNGKIVINDNDLYFSYEFGGTYNPVGLNNAWYTSKNRKSYDYDEWFRRMNEVGINYSRVWMASWGYALHIGAGAEIDNFNLRQNQAYRLERTLKLAEEYGIYIALTLINHGQFSQNINPEWNINPYKEIINYPNAFFYNSKAKAIYKDELRYIIARFGDFDSIMTYELFNEVDWTDNYNQIDVKRWHQEMGEYINSIDCYDRLISTSFKYFTGIDATQSLDVIDFVNVHTYSYQSYSGVTEKAYSELTSLINKFNKPVMFEEWGVNASSGPDTYNVDPDGTMLYQAMWGAMMSSYSTAMPWWWDTYIQKYNLYYLYQGLAQFSNYMTLDSTSKNSSDYLGDNLKMYSIEGNNNYYYIYDSSYTRVSESKRDFTDININRSINNGLYTLIIMNPLTGEVIETKDIEVTNNNFNYSVSFTNDISIILNKK